MTDIHIAKNTDRKKLLYDVLSRHIPAPFEILRTENGKPYVKDNPVYFNLTHSGNYCAVAVSPYPVGIDMEVYGRGIRKAVLSSFPITEQEEILTEKQFLQHWTARESYIKYCGGTLAHMLKLTEFSHGILSYGGEPVSPRPRFYIYDGFVLAVCCTGEVNFIKS